MDDKKVDYLINLLESNFLQMAVIIDSLAIIQSKIEDRDIVAIKKELQDKLDDVKLKFKLNVR